MWTKWGIIFLIVLSGLIRCRCQFLEESVTERISEDYLDEKNVTLTSDLLDFFNLGRTYKLWSDIEKEKLIKTENCIRDFKAFFQGLKDQKIWALKSKYSSGVVS